MNIRRAFGLTLALGGGTLGRWWHNVYRTEVTTPALTLPGLERPVRAALLTDLHLGSFIGLGSVRRWVDTTLQLRPELILLGGDFLDSQAGQSGWPGLLLELSRLKAPLGVYAVWGNHDHATWSRELPRAAADLEAVGVRVLDNRGVQLRRDLYLAGSGDWALGVQRPEAYLAGYRSGACLLLSHNPDVLPEIPRQVGLLLSGHTHGGQLNFPLTGPLYHGSRRGIVAGEVTHSGRRAYVSRGLGVTFLPLRWRAAPELALLTLRPAHLSGPGDAAG